MVAVKKSISKLLTSSVAYETIRTFSQIFYNRASLIKSSLEEAREYFGANGEMLLKPDYSFDTSNSILAWSFPYLVAQKFFQELISTKLDLILSWAIILRFYIPLMQNDHDHFIERIL